jgi:hypothetical protein
MSSYNNDSGLGKRSQPKDRFYGGDEGQHGNNCKFDSFYSISNIVSNFAVSRRRD